MVERLHACLGLDGCTQCRPSQCHHCSRLGTPHATAWAHADQKPASIQGDQGAALGCTGSMHACSTTPPATPPHPHPHPVWSWCHAAAPFAGPAWEPLSPGHPSWGRELVHQSSHLAAAPRPNPAVHEDPGRGTAIHLHFKSPISCLEHALQAARRRAASACLRPSAVRVPAGPGGALIWQPACGRGARRRRSCDRRRRRRQRRRLALHHRAAAGHAAALPPPPPAACRVDVSQPPGAACALPGLRRLARRARCGARAAAAALAAAAVHPCRAALPRPRHQPGRGHGHRGGLPSL